MGQEIGASEFTPWDFLAFARRLDAETALLGRQLAGGAFAAGEARGGFELEAWLVDATGCPAPVNDCLLGAVGDARVVPELARFNVELNGDPQWLAGDGLRHLHEGIASTWAACAEAAVGCGARLAICGIWPTVTEADLTLGNMSDQRRYRAINEQFMRLRGGRPTEVAITGLDTLELRHAGVMLESVTTSFQVHLQTAPELGQRHYNAALVASAALVAAAANSPYLFGRALWEETRIALFEQAVDVGDFGGPQRVTFGSDYLHDGVFELFERNRRDFPVMLPVLADDPPEAFAHVRLHNGTIWRWNRALLGTDRAGRPTVRLEHRCLPSGPTLVDAMANAAFFFGLVHGFATGSEPPERRLPFAVAKANFYAAARAGLAARVGWFDGREGPLAELIAGPLLAEARRGLERLEVARDAVDDYLAVIEARVRTGRTGSAWQRRHMARSGGDLAALAAGLIAGQRDGRPVHEWE